MLSPALDLAKHIDNDGFLSVDVDLFVGEFGSPNKQALFLDGVGTPAVVQDLYENPSIQVIIRGDHSEGYPIVYEFARGVYDYILDLGGPVTLNGTCYQSFTIDTPLSHLGKDDRNRHMLTMTFSTYRNA